MLESLCQRFTITIKPSKFKKYKDIFFSDEFTAIFFVSYYDFAQYFNNPRQAMSVGLPRRYTVTHEFKIWRGSYLLLLTRFSLDSVYSCVSQNVCFAIEVIGDDSLVLVHGQNKC